MAPWRYPDAAKRVRAAFVHLTGAEPASSDRSALPDHSRRNDDTMFRCWLLGMGLPNIYYTLKPWENGQHLFSVVSSLL
jgi:hypothetical protein